MKLNLRNIILNRNFIIIVFFCLLIINYVFFNYRILYRENGYILGDWVINYSGGFVKRGLLGHLFYSISKSFDISIIGIVFLFSSSVYIVSIYFFYRIIKNKLNNYWVLVFIFLPSSFLFNFFDPLSVGRKEILVIFFFCFYYLYLNKINKDFKFKVITYFLFMTILLTHEMIIFFIPYLFIIKYFNTIYNQKLQIKEYWLECLIFVTGILILFILLKINHLHNNEILCKSLQNVNLTDRTCWAINDWKNPISLNIILPYFLEKNYFINYSLYFFLSIFPLIILVFKSNNKLMRSKFIISSFFCLLFSVSFFAPVNDWGRYLHLIFLVLFLIVLKFIENDHFYKNKNFNFFKLLQFFLIFLYLTTWHMPHCCNPELGNGYFNIYERVKNRIYDNSEESTKYRDLPRNYIRKLLNVD